jgi:tetratricopeptide repeat protein 8
MHAPQAVWYLKTRALTLKDWIDDAEMDEEVGAAVNWLALARAALARAQSHPTPMQGIGDMLLDEHNMAQVARPGTSLARPMTSSAVSALACPGCWELGAGRRPAAALVVRRGSCRAGTQAVRTSPKSSPAIHPSTRPAGRQPGAAANDG